ncbi:hypothetical protein EYR38_005021 [Pleurotus pulmonarius]|nr:hypothetical protein EYR38_005021 [Pleurotus pulmonarius]
MPRSMLWDSPKPNEFPGVREFTERIREATIAAHDAILAARVKQILEYDDSDPEWAVEEILSHSGSGTDSLFEVAWKSGDITWLPYDKIAHLQAYQSYLDILGVSDTSELPIGSGSPPDDPQILLSSVFFVSPSPYHLPPHKQKHYLSPPSSPPRRKSPGLPNRHQPRRPSIDLADHPVLHKIMSQLEEGFNPDPPSSPIAPTNDEVAPPLVVNDNGPAPAVADSQIIPTATPLTRDQSFPRRDPTPHHKLVNVRVIDDMPYSYEFTNPLSGTKTIVTISDVWCVHIIAGHLRAGKHLEFYRNNYSELYYLIAKCLNQEPFLLSKECQLPMITEDGLVLKLGTHNPSAVVLGLVPHDPARGSAAKQEVMARPIPRISKKANGPAPPSTSSPVVPRDPEDPYSELYTIEPSLLFQSVVSLARTSNQELQRLKATKERSREKHAERVARRDNPLSGSRGPSRRHRGSFRHSPPADASSTDDASMVVD